MGKNLDQRAKEQQDALLLLSQKQWLAGKNDVAESLRLATEIASQTLGVQRCSIWLYAENKTIIQCLDLFDSQKQEHQAGLVLSSEKYPSYFEGLFKERIINADDAYTHKYTYEFKDSYLKPHGIRSMLDAPIRLKGQTVGVLCCEHVGDTRHWEIDEMNFAASVADFASISFELSEHKKNSRGTSAT